MKPQDLEAMIALNRILQSNTLTDKAISDWLKWWKGQPEQITDREAIIESLLLENEVESKYWDQQLTMLKAVRVLKKWLKARGASSKHLNNLKLAEASIRKEIERLS